MTDKELIKQEIERRIELLEPLECEYNKGSIDAYKGILQFINSLPEESASEDLDFLVISLEETIGTSPHSREVIKEHLQKAAEWGRNHFEDKSEMVSEDLKEAALKYCWEHPFCDGYTAYSFKAGAEWQKKKDQSTIELAEDHAMLAGMNKMKEEMMENAVEGTVKYEIGSAEIPQCDRRYQVLSDPTPIANAKLGDKVKIIIVKTKQQ